MQLIGTQYSQTTYHTGSVSNSNSLVLNSHGKGLHSAGNDSESDSLVDESLGMHETVCSRRATSMLLVLLEVTVK